MAIQTQPSRIPEPFAGSGTKNIIPATNATPSASQAASWASGFPPECSQPISAGGCPVPRNDVNGALNQLSQDFAFRQDGGIWEWSALADYDTERMVRGSDGLLYWSVAQSGPSIAAGAQDPTTDNGTYWQAMPLDDADVVHKTGAETINGDKSFTSDIAIKRSGGDPGVDLTNLDYVDTVYPQSTEYWTVNGYDKNNVTVFVMGSYVAPSGNTAAYMAVKSADNANTAEVMAYYQTNGDKFFRPELDNDLYLGGSYFRWKEVFAATATIATSDERCKDSIDSIPDSVLDAWGQVDFVQFRYKDAVEEKGVNARLHSGLVAQRIQSVFAERGLDASRYGLFCHDSWEAGPEIRNGDHVVEHAREAGDRYSLRYEEALCVEAAYQRRRADRAEARLAALEERLAAIEAKLG